MCDHRNPLLTKRGCNPALAGGVIGPFAPVVSPFIPATGLVSVLIAVEHIGEALNQRAIFIDVIISVVLGVAATAAFFPIIYFTVSRLRDNTEPRLPPLRTRQSER